MSLIQAIDLAMEFGGNYVLKDINCTVEHNSRIGLIGSNGCGKSTLIKLLLGQMNPSSGVVTRSSKCHIAYLPQNAQPDPRQTLWQWVHASRPDIVELKQQIDQLSAQFAHDHDPAVEQKLAGAVETFTAKGGYEWDNEIKYVLTSLYFPETEWEKPLSRFSGGEQTRACLASILLTPYDLLILDEPTNHLDIAMIGWLERYLTKGNRPYLIVSHDRRFLDNTVNTIYCLRNGGISITKGNYSSFKEADEIARMSQERQYERQQKSIAQTMDFIRKNMAGQKTNQAKSRLKQLNRMTMIDRPDADNKLKLRIESGKRSGNDLFVLQNASFGVAKRELARDITLWAHYRDRICIIGPNGCGKTTLLKVLLDEHPVTSGILKIGASLDIGYYDQHQVSLDEGITVMQTLWQLVPMAPQGYVLSWLARFGFRGDDVDKTVSVLSGGEKSRLYLSVLIHSNPNLLIMDEPTNHLDMDMTDALLEALQDYDGSIIFVSHDRYFLEQLASKFWVFQKILHQGEMRTSIVSPDCDAETAIQMSFAVPEPPKPVTAPRERKRKTNPLILDRMHRQIEENNARISDWHMELDQANVMLSRSETYSDASLLAEVQKKISAIQANIATLQDDNARLEDEYLELLCDD